MFNFIKEKIRKLVRKEIDSALDNNQIKQNNKRIRATSDLAQLIVDMKNDRVSVPTYEFLLRMNINPKNLRQELKDEQTK